MCELAIFNTENNSIEELVNAGMTVYQSMRTSLGIVAIEHKDGEYDYETYKALDPTKAGVKAFVEANRGTAMRFIFHGRLATHGGISEEAAHPIGIDCDECDVNHVLHNGMVHYHEQFREDHRGNHDYTTEVDSEVIAHEYGEVPEQIEDVRDDFGRQPSYILLGDERMLITTNGRYNLTTNGELGRPHRSFAPEAECETLILSATGN